METEGQEVGRIEKRLRQLGTRLDRLAAKAAEAGADVKLGYQRHIDLIKDKQAEVRSRLDAYKAAKGQKWDDFRAGVESAWSDLEYAFSALKQVPTQDTQSVSGQGTDGPAAPTPSHSE